MQDKGQDTSSFMVLLWTGWADGKSELCTADASFVGIFIFFLVFKGQKFVLTDVPFSLSLLFVVWDIKCLREADLCPSVPNNHVFSFFSALEGLITAFIHSLLLI